MKKNKFSLISAGVISFLLLTSTAYALDTTVDANASASVNAGGVNLSADAQAKLTARIEKGKSNANQEIDRRISALNSLNARIQSMVLVSPVTKANLSASIQSQITILTNLKAKIAGDSDIDTLKADIKSITLSYRIFILIIPQGHIAAMVDVIDTTADMMTALSVKIQTRITLAQNAGNDTTNLLSLLADMNAKSADSKVKAQEALNLTVNLKPDNGDQAVMKANNDALTSARASLKIAKTDLETARGDARKIVNELKAMKVNVEATSTTSI